MGNIFNDDFRDFIKALNNNEVEYLLVGGYAVVLYGYPRTTGDMDIWVNRTRENYIQLKKAFLEFGMSMFDMTEERFLYHESIDVFRFGRTPVAIDIMTKMNEFNFEECFVNAKEYIDEDLQIRLVNYDDLIEAKKKSGRNKDLDDLEKLQNNQFE